MPRAIIGAPSVSLITEDQAGFFGLVGAFGTIAITDPDPGQQAFRGAVTSIGANLGSLILLSNGNYIYIVSNAAIQYLGAGDTKIETFRVTSIDGTTADVRFTLAGVNDAAVIGDPTSVNVREDLNVSAGGLLSATGRISIRDADQNQAFFQTSVTRAADALGTLTLAANGTYTYSVSNAAVQFLGAGQTKTDSFTIRSADGTSKTVSFLINGRNDAAVIGDAANASVTEDGPTNAAGRLTATGVLGITDADQGQAAFRTTVASVGFTFGTLTLAANGAYTYSVANSAVQFLNTGQTRVDRFVVTAVDGTTKTLSFTINGLNEGAIIGTPLNATVLEDGALTAGNLTASGTLSIGGNAPGTPAFTFSTTVVPAAGALGTLTLAANGAYTYRVSNDAVQFLGVGESKVDSFTVRASDGTTKLISFTVTGANDGVQITTTSAGGAVTEGEAPVPAQVVATAIAASSLEASGSIAFTDPDLSDTHTARVITTEASPLGRFVLGPVDEAANAAGGTVGWTYTLNPDSANFLAQGQSIVETYNVVISDGKGGFADTPVRITITGTNDAVSILEGIATGEAVEDQPFLPGNFGSIFFRDPDLLDNHTTSALFLGTGTALGSLGVLLSEEAGAAEGRVDWGYTLNDALANALAEGESVEETWRVSIADPFGSSDSTDLVITITGSNDPVTINREMSTLTGRLTEDGVVVTETSVFDDIIVSSSTITELTATGRIVFTDPDLTDRHTASIILTAPEPSAAREFAYGEFILGEVVEDPASVDGSVDWLYLLDNDGAQSLGDGEEVIETFDVAIFDDVAFDTGANVATTTISVTIRGVNDAVQITTTNAVGAVTEGDAPVPDQAVARAIAASSPEASGSIAFTDPDLSDTHSASLAIAPDLPRLGVFSLGAVTEEPGAANGSVDWTYMLEDASANYLAEGQQVTESYTVIISDGKGSTDWTDVRITITGTNDPVTILEDSILSGAVTEGGEVPPVFATVATNIIDIPPPLLPPIAQGRILFSDPDVNDTLTASWSSELSESSPLGTFDIIGVFEEGGSGSVSWTYTLEDERANFLGEGQTVTESYNVTIDDGQGGAATTTVTITIVGTNDAPNGLEIDGVDEQGVIAVSEGVTGTGPIATVQGFDPDANDILTYRLEGEDSAFFRIDRGTGELAFLEPPFFNTPSEGGQDNDYELLVFATDGFEEISTSLIVRVLQTDIIS